MNRPGLPRGLGLSEAGGTAQAVTPLGFDVCAPRSSELHFGYRKELRIRLPGEAFQDPALDDPAGLYSGRVPNRLRPLRDHSSSPSCRHSDTYSAGR